MKCPSCGTEVGGVALMVGFVRIETHKCKKCGRVWRSKALIVPFCVSALSHEIERLHVRNPGKKPPHVKIAIQYLQAKLDDHEASKLEKEAATKKRRLDLWERQFLKEALGDDY